MNRIFSLAAMLYISLLFSCAPDIEPIPEYSSSSGTSSSNVSIISSSSRVSSSSVVIPSSSSSVKLSSGSVTYCLDYDWQECTLSNGYTCPDWSTPSNSCPSGWYIYNSSSSSKPSSSSSVPPSSSSVKPSSSSAVSSSSSVVVPSSSSSIAIVGDTFTDNRDGKTYKYVKIGTQTWMAENLNYNATGSKCYDNKPANCDIYGRLYDGTMAMNICPNGWHLPSDAEWTTLENFIGNDVNIKLISTSGWDYSYYERSGVTFTDDYGFSALPGGHGDPHGGFGNIGFCGAWWNSSGYHRGTCADRPPGDLDRQNFIKSYYFSVRCVKD